VNVTATPRIVRPYSGLFTPSRHRIRAFWRKKLHEDCGVQNMSRPLLP